jgi:hypothetical protein
MSDQATTSSRARSSGGLLVTGGTLTISGLSFCLHTDGRIESGPISVLMELDMCPHWLEITLDHLGDAIAAHEAVLAAIVRGESVGAPLKRELHAGMQTIIAASTALDAYYADIKNHIKLDQMRVRKTRKKITRYRQIAEVLRRGFKIRQDRFQAMRDNLKELQTCRDWVVHPPAGAKSPVFLDDVGCGVDWQYVAFGQRNARMIAWMVFNIIWGTATQLPTDMDRNLKTYCQELAKRIQPLVEKWEERHGTLLPPANVAPAP